TGPGCVNASGATARRRGRAGLSRPGPECRGLNPRTTECHMRTAQRGDQVHVHYVKRAENGAVASSHGRAPLEVTVGADHRRLPGLGLALVGHGEGERVRVRVPAEQAYGPRRAERLRRLGRARVADGQELATGSWVRVTGRRRQRRLVRVVEVCDEVVVVDTSHPWAGQAVTLEVEIVTIRAHEGGAGGHESSPEVSLGG